MDKAADNLPAICGINWGVFKEGGKVRMQNYFGNMLRFGGLVLALTFFGACSSGGESELEDPIMEQPDESGEETFSEMGADAYDEESDYAESTSEAIEEQMAEVAEDDVDSYELDEAITQEPSADVNVAEEAGEYGSDEETFVADDVKEMEESVEEKIEDLEESVSGVDKETMELASDENAPEAGMDSMQGEAPMSMPASDGAQVVYIARPGDTLASIAGQIFGDQSRFKELATDNNISNPNRIFPGDEIRFQVDANSQEFANELKSAKMASVTVKRGDTLSKISKRIFNDGNAWQYLWRFNVDQIPDPNRIEVGQRLSYMPLKSMPGYANIDESPDGKNGKTH